MHALCKNRMPPLRLQNRPSSRLLSHLQLIVVVEFRQVHPRILLTLQFKQIGQQGVTFPESGHRLYRLKAAIAPLNACKAADACLLQKSVVGGEVTIGRGQEQNSAPLLDKVDQVVSKRSCDLPDSVKNHSIRTVLQGRKG